MREIVEQESSPLRLTEAQQAEVRSRLNGKREMVPVEEMDAFFRGLGIEITPSLSLPGLSR